jgi:hypothetical protein
MKICDGTRDVACQRVGTGAVDPARAQAEATSCWGGASGQRPWGHYTSSCPGSHVAARPLRRTDMSAAVGTGDDMSAPSARRVLVGAPRRARGRPPGTCCDAPWGAGTGPGRALAQNLHSVSLAAALGATASAPGGIAAADCIGVPQHMVRTDGPHVAMVQADQTVREQKVNVERDDRTERDLQRWPTSCLLPPQ